MGCILGADVEVFISTKKRGTPRPSNKKIPDNGVRFNDETGHDGTITRDGFQAEFQLYPSTCRAYVTNSLKQAIISLDKKIGTLKIDTRSVIEIPKTVFDKLDEESKMFGCNPSSNNFKPSPITVDPTVYRNRSAGGHIHMSTQYNKPEKIKDFVMLCDIIIGNTCVLIDRDPMQKERRKVYGRAGEYRIKPYGVEYRTPSNFWIRHGAIASFVLGLAKLPHKALAFGEHKKILSNSNMDAIQDAINNNDYNLAKENFKKVENLLYDLCGRWDQDSYPFGIDSKNRFIKYLMISKCKCLFPDDYDLVNYWKYEKEGHDHGIDTYTNKMGNYVPNDIEEMFNNYTE